MKTNRRAFLKSATAVTLGFCGWQGCISRGGFQSQAARAPGYGPLLPDQDQILDLPQGFRYHIVSRHGEPMTDGLLVPGLPDGMAAFPGPNGRTLLIRNHEISSGAADRQGAFGKGNEHLSAAIKSRQYDPGKDAKPCLGGTSTILYDTRRRRTEAQWLSLSGTLRNCAGGPTPWNSWITCEETVELPGPNTIQRHGYNFEVPATPKPELHQAVPLKDMGRFNHEAIAVDPASGIVYETEDRPDSSLYRFIPNTPGKLREGGRLQALAVADSPGLDTRNWTEQKVTPGAKLNVRWVNLDEVDGKADNLRYRANQAGAARFARGEGMWQGNDAIYFACTSGGANKKGQIWRYIPSPNEGQASESASPGSLELFIEPNDEALVDKADNLTVAPWGDLVICEDGAGEQFLVGVTPAGEIYKLGHNPYSTSEFAGATFSPDGSTLFVNIQRPGLTLAITGPWKHT